MIRKVINSVLVVVIGSIALLRRRSGKSEALAEQKAPRGLRSWFLRGTIILVLLGVGGFLLAASGIIPIKASSGHWAITRWFLNFSKERSVTTHSLKVKVPDLDADWQVVKGAGHYESGCRPCHGSPGMAQPRIGLAMLPNPPPLGPKVREWSPAELFYITKHGIKFTGMPAWPARDRDDEIWAIVAFLRKLPTLDAADYRRLVYGPTPRPLATPMEGLVSPATVPKAVIENCARCHGIDGNGRGMGAFPKLAGQKKEYLLGSLQAYARGERPSGFMEPIAAALDEQTMEELARYYSELSRFSPEEVDPLVFEKGKAIAAAGIPQQMVPACVDCHLPGSRERNPVYPRLAGQYPEYLKLQLELFQKGKRGGTAYKHIMYEVAHGLKPEQIEAVAAFFAGMKTGSIESSD